MYEYSYVNESRALVTWGGVFAGHDHQASGGAAGSEEEEGDQAVHQRGDPHPGGIIRIMMIMLIMIITGIDDDDIS